MKKLLLLISMFGFLTTEAQNYYGSEFIGEGGVNYPTGFAKSTSKLAISGYIGGSLTGDFPISFLGGNTDGVLTSISPTDGKIQWIKQFGGGGDEVVIDSVIDGEGNYYVTGYMMTSGSISLDADPGASVYPLPVESSLANRDIFLIKLDPNGDFLWAKKMCTPAGSSGANDDVSTIALDSQGNIILAGAAVYVDFDPGVGNQIYTSPTGSSDAFIVKLDKDGNFIWVKTMAGTSSKRIMQIAIDENDNIYAVGRYQGTIDLNPSSTEDDIRTTAGNYDTFLAKYNSSGDYVWGLSYGDTGSDLPEKIILNENNIYVGGSFSNTVDLDPTSGVNSVTALGGVDGYISSFTKDGVYNSSFVIPGTTSNLDTVKDIYFDSSDNIYLSGTFQNMTLGSGTYAATAANSDNYYIKLTPNMMFSNIYLIQGTQQQSVPYITGYDNNKFLVIGGCKGAAAFDYTNPTVTTTYSNALYYTYLTKFDFETQLATQEATNNKLVIYPNPVKTNVFLNSDSKIKTIVLYNIEGQNVYTVHGQDIKSLNLSILPKGIYFLQATDEKGKISQSKLIKE